jgi:membrane fusion protein, multidrug efflux system
MNETAESESRIRTGGRSRKLRRLLLAAIAGCIVAVVVISGIRTRRHTEAELVHRAEAEALPQVTLVTPRKGAKTRPLDLPGEVKAWYQAPIYAQVSGYVREWYKDYGAPVKAGDLLATIDTPALDQQLAQAKSALQVREAEGNLAEVTASRWAALVRTNSVSVESSDVKEADAAAARARVEAAKQVVARYQALEAFKRVVAPFDGIVTSRRTDIGDYVNANGGDSGEPGHSSALFEVADMDTMRVFVSVPQDYSGFLGPDAAPTLTFPQFPNQNFKATYSTSAKSFDPVSRTVLVELFLPNPEGKFWPNTYVDVNFEVPIDPNILVIPEQSILFRAHGLQVGLVDDRNKVHLQDIKIGLNFGATVQVLSGLNPGDRLIANPSDGLLEGELVQVANAPAANADVED